MNSEERREAALAKADDVAWKLKNLCQVDIDDEILNMLSQQIAIAALEAAGLNELVDLERAITACNKDTFECPVCGHSEPWWTDSNADLLTNQRHSAALTGDKSNG